MINIQVENEVCVCFDLKLKLSMKPYNYQLTPIFYSLFCCCKHCCKFRFLNLITVISLCFIANTFVVLEQAVLILLKTYPQKVMLPITIYIIVLLLLLAPYLSVNNYRKDN